MTSEREWTAEVEAPEWSLELATAAQDNGLTFDPREARVTVFPTIVELRVNAADEHQAHARIRSAFEAAGMAWSDEMVKRIAPVPETRRGDVDGRAQPT